MKSVLFIVLLACAGFLQTANAQAPVGNGQSQLNAGIGLSSWGLPVYVGLDYGAARDITVGGEVSFRSYGENWTGRKYNHTIIGISGNFNYHLNTVLKLPRQWNIYAGLNLGFYYWSSPSEYGGGGASGLGLGGQLGARYYFGQSTGINLEVGGGNAFSGGKIGLTFKL
ncbi:MAG: hypothetical protein JNL32_05965 [Candidatus Kapabacteria bacterium]|nr:hypothetical protein [Candidatus Kapabacteria bacterium]